MFGTPQVEPSPCVASEGKKGARTYAGNDDDLRVLSMMGADGCRNDPPSDEEDAVQVAAQKRLEQSFRNGGDA
jgi:hypothetical protein